MKSISGEARPTPIGPLLSGDDRALIGTVASRIRFRLSQKHKAEGLMRKLVLAAGIAVGVLPLIVAAVLIYAVANLNSIIAR